MQQRASQRFQRVTRHKTCRGIQRHVRDVDDLVDLVDLDDLDRTGVQSYPYGSPLYYMQAWYTASSVWSRRIWLGTGTPT